jgi:hypothetical protein
MDPLQASIESRRTIVTASVNPKVRRPGNPSLGAFGVTIVTLPGVCRIFCQIR